MNVNDAIVEVLKAAQAGLPVLLLGSPGIGKTTIAFAVACKLGLPYMEIRAAEFESVDFRGIPSIVDGKTKWNPPDFWPTEACVLNFDEVTQAPMELTSPLLKIFLGGAIGDYTLPPGTVIMATGNLASDRAGCSRLSSALRERCIVINIEPMIGEWMDWFEKQPFYDETVHSFLKQNPSLFHSWDAKLDYNQPTPRNWARVAKLLSFDPAEETVAGIIGKDVALSFFRYRRTFVKLPTVSDVILGKAKAPTSPALMTTFVKDAAQFFKMAVESDDSDSVAAQAVHMVEFDFDGTYQVQFLKQIAKLNIKLLRHKELSTLLKRHAKAIVDSK